MGEEPSWTLLRPTDSERNIQHNDDTSSDDDDFEDVEYVSLEEVNDDQEEKEFDLDDILQIQEVILREKLLKTSIDYPDFEDSHAHGFVHSYIRASYPQLHLGDR
ncbi:hypothetical protein Tco_1577447 [Tanacetum coccineum]